MSRHHSFKTFVVCLFFLSWVVLPPAMAQQAIPNASQGGDASIAGTNLDLSSTSATMANNSSQGVDIQMAGTVQTVTPGMTLTPAQYLAVQQVLSGGSQQLLLGAGGQAVGGSFALSGLNLQQIAGLVVPQGVTAIYDAATGQSLNLAGNLTNSGTLYALSTNSAITSATFSALNIVNQQGALISSVVPVNGLAGFSNLVSSLNLNLLALQDIVNAGMITSSANLSLIAGGSIVNSLPSGVTGMVPVMQAMSNLNLQASQIVNSGQLLSQMGNLTAITSQLQNAGLMQSLQGSIAIQSILSNNLLIDNLLGTIKAQQNIAFSTLAQNTTKLDLTVSGGTLVGDTVLFSNPNGFIDAHLDRIDGNVQVSGGDAKIGVKAGTLVISQLDLTGDPVLSNSGGDLDLVGQGTFGGGAIFSTVGTDFIAYASGNITAVGAPVGATVDAGNAAGTGGRILFVAGTSSFDGGGNPILCTSCAASQSGGDISIGGVALRTNGNEIGLRAYAGTNASGNISVGLLDSSGKGATCCYNQSSVPAASGQNAGAITVNAGGTLTTGAIRAFGGGGAGGYATAASGGAGGTGGTVTLDAIGNIFVNGEINTSGGGGGGLSASQVLSTFGGAGGSASNITVTTYGTFISSGPLLAAGGGGGAGTTVPPCCPQVYRNGGGSFGGGGGGGDVGAGGGGFYGGGGSLSFGSGGGGGFFGGGGGDNAQPNGSLGSGGSSTESGGVFFPGGTFGVGGDNVHNKVAQQGYGNAGGAAGNNGNISITAQSMSTQADVATWFGGLGNGFTNSPFATTTTFGGVTFTLAPAAPPPGPTPPGPTPPTPVVQNTAAASPVTAISIEPIDVPVETFVNSVNNFVGSAPTRVDTDMTPIAFSNTYADPLMVSEDIQVAAEGEQPLPPARISMSNCPPVYLQPDGRLTTTRPFMPIDGEPTPDPTNNTPYIPGYNSPNPDPWAPIVGTGTGTGTSGFGLPGIGGGGGGSFNLVMAQQLQAQLAADMANLQAILIQTQNDARLTEQQRLQIMQDTQTQIFRTTQQMTINAARIAEQEFNRIDGYIRGVLDLPIMVASSSDVVIPAPYSSFANMEVPVQGGSAMMPFPWIRMFVDTASIEINRTIKYVKNPIKKFLEPLANLDMPVSKALLDSPFPWRATGQSLQLLGLVPDVSANIQDLPFGSAFISLEEPVIFASHSALVTVKPGAKVAVMNVRDALAIFNLFDKRHGDVKVVIDNKEVVIPPGQEIVLYDGHTSHFDSVNPGNFIAHRHLKEHKLNNGMTLFQCDFSIVSAMRNIGTLNSMRTSGDPLQRKITSDIMKMAVLLGQVHGARGPYKTSAPQTSMFKSAPSHRIAQASTN